MRFIVIFQNEESIRQKIMPMITHMCHQGHNFSRVEESYPLFAILPAWPNPEVLFKVPLNVQIEELIWENKVLTLIQKLVMDIETELIKEPNTATDNQSSSNAVP